MWPSDSTVNIGDNVELMCRAGNGGAATSFEWDLKGMTPPTEGKPRFAFVVSEKSAGDYKCKAINADGSTDSITQTLIVKGESQ